MPTITLQALIANKNQLKFLPEKIQDEIQKSNGKILTDWRAAIENTRMPDAIGKTSRTRIGKLNTLKQWAGKKAEPVPYPHSILVTGQKQRFVLTQFTLGYGGSGKVKLGINTETGQLVAIKIITEEAQFAQIRETQERLKKVLPLNDNTPFLIDAVIELEKVGPNRIPITIKDNDDDSESEDELTGGIQKSYLVMPFIPGEKLSMLLFTPRPRFGQAKKKFIPFSTKLEWAISLVEEVDKFHRAGFIITDIKPQNCQVFNNKITLIDLDYTENSIINRAIAAPRTKGYNEGIHSTQNQATDLYGMGATIGEIFTSMDDNPGDKSIYKHIKDYVSDYVKPDPIETRICKICDDLTSGLNPESASLVLRKLKEIKVDSDKIEHFAENIDEISTFEDFIKVYARLIHDRKISDYTSAQNSSNSAQDNKDSIYFIPLYRKYIQLIMGEVHEKTTAFSDRDKCVSVFTSLCYQAQQGRHGDLVQKLINHAYHLGFTVQYAQAERFGLTSRDSPSAASSSSTAHMTAPQFANACNSGRDDLNDDAETSLTTTLTHVEAAAENSKIGPI